YAAGPEAADDPVRQSNARAGPDYWLAFGRARWFRGRLKLPPKPRSTNSSAAAESDSASSRLDQVPASLVVFRRWARNESRRDFARLDLVHVTPDPGFSGFDRTNQGMLCVVKVFGGVLVLGWAQAPHVTAAQAHSQ